MWRAVGVVYLDFSKVFDTVFPQPSAAEKGKIQTGWVMCEIGRKLVHWLHSEGDQWFLIRLAACHKFSSPGINRGPHACSTFSQMTWMMGLKAPLRTF